MLDKKSCYRRDEKYNNNDDGNNKNDHNSSQKQFNNKPKSIDEIKTNKMSLYPKNGNKNGRR